MKSIARRGNWLVLVLGAGFFVLPTSTARAQDIFHDDLMKFGSERPTVYGIGNGVKADYDPGPYDGQIYCPVTGNKLAVDGSAVKVQTTVGAVEPSRTQKFFGAKSSPGMVIYVCCPECAKKVKANPQPYVAEVIADHATISFHFAEAPPQRPERPLVKRADQDVKQASERTPSPTPIAPGSQEVSPLQR
jgi:hypothetical protein